MFKLGKQQGTNTAKEVWEKASKEELPNSDEVIQYIVKDLLAAITEKDILTVTNKGWYTGSRKLTQEEVAQLKEECQGLKESVLWKLMSNEIRYLANLQMFEKGIDRENTVFGRAMLYNLELLDKFIDRCSNL